MLIQLLVIAWVAGPTYRCRILIELYLQEEFQKAKCDLRGNFPEAVVQEVPRRGGELANANWYRPSRQLRSLPETKIGAGLRFGPAG